MLNNKTIAVVVPAYNEEKQIRMVIDTMPDFVDRIIIVNDFSNDNTAKIVEAYIQNEIKSLPIKARKSNRYTIANEFANKIDKEELKYFTPLKFIIKIKK